jgi:AraC-like DNA-binding protein
VSGGHDRASESLAESSEPVRSTLAGDPLSDVLKTVRLTGALFFLADASTPWVVDIPTTDVFASILLPGAQQIISYHVVMSGACWGGLTGEPPVPVEAGDVLLIPHGDAYVMSSTAGMRSPDPTGEALAFFRQMAAGPIPPVVVEGGGGAEHLHVVCGFLGCDVRPFNPVLATLPRLVHLHRPSGAAADRLSRLVEIAVAESSEAQSGGRCVLLRLSELMFVEVVRRYLVSLPGDQIGWLAGLRDPQVARALAALHGRPGHPWTLEGLAKEVHVSRSTLAERFHHFVGQPPMQYLAQWRMQLAARRLADGAEKVSAVALDVGYESEAAFSRAFKKIVGTPPAEWRRRASAA